MSEVLTRQRPETPPPNPFSSAATHTAVQGGNPFAIADSLIYAGAPKGGIYASESRYLGERGKLRDQYYKSMLLPGGARVPFMIGNTELSGSTKRRKRKKYAWTPYSAK